MSDDELANFFAKKDRSKKKNKKNKVNSVTQQLQVENNENVEDEVKKTKKKTNKSDLESMEQILGINDNDWEEHNTDDIDYSTLRLQSLVVSDASTPAEDHNADRSDCSDVSDDEDKYNNQENSSQRDASDKLKESGPWKETHYVPVKINLEPEPERIKAPEPVAPSGPKRYVPPSMRMGGGGGGGASSNASSNTTSAMRRRGGNVKLNVNSKADFPCLAPGVGGPNGPSVGFFTKVKDGAKNDYSQEVTQKVSVDNKFKALSN